MSSEAQELYEFEGNTIVNKLQVRIDQQESIEDVEALLKNEF